MLLIKLVVYLKMDLSVIPYIPHNSLISVSFVVEFYVFQCTEAQIQNYYRASQIEIMEEKYFADEENKVKTVASS